MKVRDDGSLELNDGTVLTQDDAIRLHKKATKKEAKEPDKRKRLELREGECSGKIELTD